MSHFSQLSSIWLQEFTAYPLNPFLFRHT
uniref:Uncharacterized protein n=1 Tax=Anguilla anguilla TaxID=7936 RepID=A0A0E9XNX3_ANGAN